jgi:hypothetical protein
VNYVASETIIDENGDEIEVPAFDCLACQNDLEEVEPEVFLTEGGMLMRVA